MAFKHLTIAQFYFSTQARIAFLIRGALKSKKKSICIGSCDLSRVHKGTSFNKHSFFTASFFYHQDQDFVRYSCYRPRLNREEYISVLVGKLCAHSKVALCTFTE